MTRFSIATTLVPGDLLGKLEKIAAAGFSDIELHEPDLTGFAGTVESVGERAVNLGLTINVFQLFRDFEGLGSVNRDVAFERLDQKLELMNTLGAKILLIGSSTNRDASFEHERVVADFSELADRVQKFGCRAALIALPWAKYITREVEALEIVEAVDSPFLGLALNSFFSLANGSQAARLRDIPGDRVFHVQISDAPVLDFDITCLKSHFGLLPGQGGLNLASFVRVLARAGYAGPWSVSRIGATIADSRETYASDGYRALVSLIDEVAEHEPAVPRPIGDLPRKVSVRGFEFIEFAVDDKAHHDLTTVLSSMAFRKERQHCSKFVELWRQGAVNIVINSEKKGFSADALAEHGPCVCDMGLRVQDADQTVKRATMLGAPPFSQPVGSGELDIPAIKGVGGSVVHFIDERSDLHRVWDIEFDPVPKDKSPQPAGLRRVDHLAQTMRYQEMQSWLTYYLSTVEMEKADVVDVTDPSGIILSQALSSPGGEVRLNLNGARGQRTFAGSFLSRSSGAGVQHIAFTSDDIFETSDLLADSSFNRLNIADNYYEDLRVKFGLDNKMIEKLREGNILYDRDEKGEYYQMYSTMLWNGFFFEIVERRGGYEGYGACNAPIRLAAQMQHASSWEV